MTPTTTLGGAAAALLLFLPACKPRPAAFVPPPPPPVTVEQPQPRDVPVVIEESGTTRAVETVELRPRVQGFVQQRLVEGGRRVAAGDLLFHIDPRPFELRVQQRRAELAAATAQLQLGEVTLGRTQAAVTQDAAAKIALDRATAERDDAKAKLELARALLASAELDLDYTEVRAPRNGRLSAVVAQPGQLVDQDNVLATLADDTHVYATFHLTEREFAELQHVKGGPWPDGDGTPGLPVTLAVGDETDFVHRGTLDRRDNAVDPTTGTIRVEAVFDNQDGALLPGMFARVRLELAREHLLTVPDVAVGSDPQGRFLLVVDGQGLVSRRAVELAGAIDGRRGIRAGLQGDEQVVVDGLQRARPGSRVAPQQQVPGR